MPTPAVQDATVSTLEDLDREATRVGFNAREFLDLGSNPKGTLKGTRVHGAIYTAA